MNNTENINLKNIRWAQRFSNFNKAFLLLTQALQYTSPDVVQQAGIVHYESLQNQALKDHIDNFGVTIFSRV